LLLPGEDDRAEDGNEDKNRRDLEGEQEFREEHLAELGDVVGEVREVAADSCEAKRAAFLQENEGEQTEDGGGSGEAGGVGGAAAPCPLFFAGVEQHDDEDEEDHDGAGVDDDLGGGEELGAERPVEDRERHHDDNERECAVDGMALEEQIQCACYGDYPEDDEERKLHVLAV